MSWSRLLLSSVAKALEHTSLPGCFLKSLFLSGGLRVSTRVWCLFLNLPSPSMSSSQGNVRQVYKMSLPRPSPLPTHINSLSYLPQVQWLTPWWWWLSNVSQTRLFTCRLDHSFRIHVDTIYGQQASGRVGPVEPRTTLQPTGKVYLALMFSSQAWEVTLSSVHSFLHSLSYRKGSFMKDRRLYFQWHHQIPFF